MIAEVHVFKALGDPTRLEIVRRLSKSSPLNMTAVSDDLGVTRQGVRKHLQVLIDARVVRTEVQGRDVLVHMNPQVLTKAEAFIAKLSHQWENRLSELKNFVESGQ